jgi:hypothetical protein
MWSLANADGKIRTRRIAIRLRRLSRGFNRAVTDRHCLEVLCFVRYKFSDNSGRKVSHDLQFSVRSRDEIATPRVI